MSKRSGLHLLPVLGIFSVLMVNTGWAATFNASNVTEFQNMLNTAATNNQNDIINVAPGTYNIATTLTYNSGQNFSLTISGAGTGLTILDGGNIARILSLITSQPAGNLTVRNMTFRNGTTTANGGALFIDADTGAITVSDCAFNDNTTTGSDGIAAGMHAFSNTGAITITKCVFRRNISSGNVGGLFIGTTSGNVHVTQSSFENNGVTNVGGSSYFGDAGGAMLYSEGLATFNISSNTFSSNTASGGDNPDGGGLMTYHLGTGVNVTMENNTFTNNQAGLGGGGSFTRINGSGNVTCSNNTYSSNTAIIGSGAGSLVYVNNGTLTFHSNIISGNEAGESGGGASIDLLDGTATVSGNTCFGNRATENGGALVIMTESGTVNFHRNILSSNITGNVGGGISYATTTGVFNCSHNTFYNNTAADGGAIYCYYDEPGAVFNLKNLILWNDTPNEINYSSGTGPGSMTLTYSDIAGGSSQPWFGTGCINADPFFSNPASGNFNLSWANFPVNDTTRSPCIDTGDPSSVNDPDGTRADMGARYFNQSPADVSLELCAGLNMVSLPYENASITSADSLLVAVCGGKADAVWWYNCSTKSFQSWTILDTGTGWSVWPGMPFWVNITGSSGCTWTPAGNPITSISFSLCTGLNMVSLPLHRPDLIKASHLLAAIPNCTAVYRCKRQVSCSNPSGFDSYFTISSPSEDFDLIPARSYWVNVTSSTSWNP